MHWQEELLISITISRSLVYISTVSNYPRSGNRDILENYTTNESAETGYIYTFHAKISMFSPKSHREVIP